MGRQRAPRFASGQHMVPYLRAANVKDDRLQLDEVLTMNFTPEEQEKFRLRLGDVLVTEGCGSLKQIGACAIWRNDIEGAVCFQNTLLRLRARLGRCQPSYLAQWSRWAYRDGIYASVASGTNIYHIGATRAAAMTVPCPPLQEQERVSAVLDALTSVRRAAADEREGLVRSFGALLDELLSGHHLIPAAYDDVLERAS